MDDHTYRCETGGDLEHYPNDILVWIPRMAGARRIWSWAEHPDPCMPYRVGVDVWEVTGVFVGPDGLPLTAWVAIATNMTAPGYPFAASFHDKEAALIWAQTDVALAFADSP
jgi:hypothetical protein